MRPAPFAPEGEMGGDPTIDGFCKLRALPFHRVWTNGAADLAMSIRRSADKFGSRIKRRRKSRGDEFEEAAQMAAFFKTVLLFGVPRWRPPRRSPGFDPLGIAILLFFPDWPD
jgi:hypothetical protein